MFNFAPLYTFYTEQNLFENEEIHFLINHAPSDEIKSILENYQSKIGCREILVLLRDEEWRLDYIDHDRRIARAIVVDDEGYFYFVRVDRNDDFGKAILIETAGGGVEEGEDLRCAVLRELKEELGVEAEILCKIGVVRDYYNLIHRHNINNYFLCKVKSFSEKALTQDEIEQFHLSTLKLTFDEAISEYELRSDTKLGRLVANREMPILRQARKLLDEMVE